MKYGNEQENNSSRMDDLFFALFGFYPKKAGMAYEMLVGAVLKIIGYNKVVLNESKRGNFDGNFYQIDAGLYELNMDSIMVEAKDYTSSAKKKPVRREDLDKIAGALLELDYVSGFFFSATDYTVDAVRKAKASHINPRSTKLSLFHLKPSIDEDRKGRLERIQIDLVAYSIRGEGSTISPHIPNDIFQKWQSKKVSLEGLTSRTEFFCNDNQISCSGDIFDLNNQNVGFYKFTRLLEKDFYQTVISNGNHIEGIWDVDGEVTCHGDTMKLEKVGYSLKFGEQTMPIIISTKGNPVLKIVSEDMQIDTLITDNQLRGITFMPDGEITFDGSVP